MIKGTEVEIGGTTYTVPPLSLGAIERFQDKIAAPTSADIIDICHAAIVRNYPDVTRDQFADAIDLENFQRVFDAVMLVSGMKPAAGEARPAKRSR